MRIQPSFAPLGGRAFIRALVVVTILLQVPEAGAQRPVRVFDPFYQGETAQRGFFDRYAVTGEFYYRPVGFLQGDALTTGSGDALGVNVKVDYQVNDHVDVGMYLDATNSGLVGAPSLRWLTLKYYQADEFADYAIRLAVDPVSHGASGFPLLDLAFLYGSPGSPAVRTDYAIGLRRAQIGVQEIVPIPPAPIDPDDPIVKPPTADRKLIRTQALGWEVHMSGQYSMVMDPAGSSLYVSLLAEGGSYSLVEWEVGQAASDRIASDFAGGVIWTTTGLQFERPSYRFAPYLAIPLKQWAPSDGEWPHRRARVGFRLTLR